MSEGGGESSESVTGLVVRLCDTFTESQMSTTARLPISQIKVLILSLAESRKLGRFKEIWSSIDGNNGFQVRFLSHFRMK